MSLKKKAALAAAVAIIACAGVALILSPRVPSPALCAAAAGGAASSTVVVLRHKRPR